MAADFYGFDDDDSRSQGKDHLFLWTVFILLLIGLAFACWLGSFYVFGHPEQPRSYAILKKLKKLEAPKRFEVTQAPTGEFLTPQKLFDRYSKFERLQLEAVNAELLRNYIKNYKEAKGLVPYITGRFEIVDTYQLQPGDIFPSGIVAVGVANDYSQVVIEHVFTTPPESVAALQANLPRGLDMRLEKTRDPVAIIHVEWTDDGRLMFTAMPLLYGTWGVKGSIGSFSLEPPPGLNLKAGVPIVKGTAFADMMTRFAETRRTRPAPKAAQEGTPAPAEPELVRVDTVKPGTAVPDSGAIPDLPVATPIPLAPPRGTGPKVAGRATPLPPLTRATPALARGTPPPMAGTPPQLAMNATPSPNAATAPTPIPGLPPVESLLTPKMARPGVPLKPFISSAPLATGGGNWRTYSRGQQPPGRSITPSEASKMAEKGGEIAEHLYLHGDFVVTASGDNRAVLRAPAALGEPSRDGAGSARILVEYPPSAAPPPVGSTLSRDAAEGFEVREVRRGQDGQINIYVREITRG
jgi:hypothetical protein